MHIYNYIKSCNTSIEQMEEDKKQFKPRLYSIAAGNPKTKSKDQLDTTEKN